MELKFSSPVNRHYFALRCVPGDSLRQKIRLEECRVEPADYLREIRDAPSPHISLPFQVYGF